MTKICEIRRRDQRGYRLYPDDGTNPNQLISGNRGYATPGDRKRAIAALFRRGYDHFVCYMDTQAHIALMFGTKSWDKGRPYIIH